MTRSIRGVALELRGGRAECDLGRRPGRIAVDARRDRRERDRAATELHGDLERAAVTRGQERGLARVAALPDRPDGMDHVSRREVAGRRRLRVAGLAASEEPRLGEDRRPAHAMDRPVDASAAQERRVRGVDDRIDLLLRDVALHELDPAHWPKPTVTTDERR